MGACVIVKHGNPCGVALDDKQKNAYIKALKCDPVSAFGGIVAFNKTVDEFTAREVEKFLQRLLLLQIFHPRQ